MLLQQVHSIQLPNACQQLQPHEDHNSVLRNLERNLEVRKVKAYSYIYYMNHIDEFSKAFGENKSIFQKLRETVSL